MLYRGQRFGFWLVAVFLLLVTAAPGPAQEGVTLPKKPPRAHFFVDDSGVIGSQEAIEIDRIAAELLKEEDVALIVVTISSLAAHNAAGWAIERYAKTLFDQWGIGKRSRNYGMLLLVSPLDRRARIELGAGWSRSHDRDAEEIMTSLVVPQFKQSRYGEGILAGVRGLDAMARGLSLPAPERPWWRPLLMVGFFALGIGLVVSLFRSGRKGWGWALLAFLGVILFFVIRSSFANTGSGGSFGGGFSGGGGASGSW